MTTRHESRVEHVDVRGGMSRCQAAPTSAREAQPVCPLSRKQWQHVRCTLVIRYPCRMIALSSCSAAMAQS